MNDVPYIVHESMMTRMERTIKKLWILCIILIGLLLATNVGWIIYESQFEEVTTTTHTEVTQDTDNGGNNYAVGGDWNNGKTDN